MKCTNPTKCAGEMSTYKGIEAGKVECSTCGYRIDAPKTKVSDAPKVKEVVSTENKETK